MTATPAAPPSDELIERIRRLERQSRPLDPGASRRRRLHAAVNAFAERFLRRRHSMPGYDQAAGTGLGLRAMAIGESGHPLDRALELLDREVVRPGAATASGRHLAYIPGGGLYHGALGDFLAAITNKYSGVFLSGPGAVRMENQVLRWVADLVGYPDTAGGHTASGGSIANLTAVATARDAHGITSAQVPRAVVYTTAQAHHSIAKGLHLAGLAEAPVRRIPLDAGFRMQPDALRAAIQADRAAGLQPWLVVANAGSTDIGAVDPLEAIAEVAAEAGCWLHVDAAYGGFFLLTEAGRARMRGIARADSVVLDPHKCLFLPYGSGIILVRDVRHLITTHGHTASYMQDAATVRDELEPATLSPELTRPFRALRMWLPLIHLGVAPFRAALEEKLLLARVFRDRVAALGFEVGPPPDLSVVTYRWALPGADAETTNRFNLDLIRAAREDGRVYLSSTVLDGRVWLRMVAVAHRTHLREINLALAMLGDLVQRRAS